MTFWQTILVKGVLLVALVLLPLMTHAQTKICLTGRLEESLPTYRAAFIQGAKLAVQDLHLNRAVNIQPFFYDDKPLAPILTYRVMVKQGCSAIIGFEYLSDLLLIQLMQTNESIPIFTSYASTMRAKPLAQNIFIFRSSYRAFAARMIAFLQHRYGALPRVLLVTEINRESMRQYQEAYQAVLKEHHIAYDTFLFLENDKYLVTKLKKYSHGKPPYRFMILLSGAVASAKIANAFDHQRTIFIGTENYGSSSSQSFYLGLVDKHITAYFIRSLDFLKPTVELAQWSRHYQNVYHTKPMVLSAYTYDATRICLMAFKHAGQINTRTVLGTEYDGVTGAFLHHHQFHRSTQTVILRVSPSGYRDVS